MIDARTFAIGLRRGQIELLQFFREREAMLFTFLLPIAIYCLFAITMTGEVVLAGETVDHDTYMLPGLVAAGVMLTSFQSVAITVASDRSTGALKRLRMTPMPPTSFFIGKVILVVVSSLVQVGLLTLIAGLVFDRWGPVSFWRFLVIWLVGCAAGTTLGIAFSSLLRNPRSAPTVVASVSLLLQFVCGVFFIFTELPEWLQRVAQALPLTWLTRGMRSAYLPERLAAAERGGAWQLDVTIVVLLAWFSLGLVLCLRSFRWVRV